MAQMDLMLSAALVVQFPLRTRNRHRGSRRCRNVRFKWSWYAAFLVEGKEKQEIFSRLRRGGSDLPAAQLRPSGELIWFVDEAAARSEARQGSQSAT